MTYTLYNELQEFGDTDKSIGNIPEDLKHRISIVLEDGSFRQVTYYDILLDHRRIGMIEDVHKFGHPLAEAIIHANDPNDPYFAKNYYKRYIITQPKRTEAEARAESHPSVKNIYMFDEYYWHPGTCTDDCPEDCGDAWYPTFPTLETFIKEYLRRENAKRNL